MEKRDWILRVGVSRHYLTDEEAKTFLSAVQNGEKFFQFKNGLVVTTNFQELTPPTVTRDELKLSEGKWQCSQGNWHSLGVECFCEYSFEEINGKMVRVKKTKNSLVKHGTT